MQITSLAVPRERRNVADRDALLRRVWDEFVEMRCLRLTEAQARRLFALRADVCQRILAGLVDAEALTVGPDGRYRLRDDSGSALTASRSLSRASA